MQACFFALLHQPRFGASEVIEGWVLMMRLPSWLMAIAAAFGAATAIPVREDASSVLPVAIWHGLGDR